MTIRRELAWSLPGTPEQILRRVAEPAVARRRARAEPTLDGAVTQLATDTADGAILVFEVTATVPHGWVPARVAAALPGVPRIVRREAWRLGPDGSARADLTIRPENIPMTTMAGAGTLSPDGEGTSTLAYELRLDVAIPLVGGTIERAVMDQICRGYDSEAAVIAEA